MDRKFVCSFCKSEHNTAPERARCELTCAKRIEEEVEKERQDKLRKERDARAAEVREAKERYLRLEAAFKEDYQNDIWCTSERFKKDFPMFVFGGWDL